MTVYSSIVKLQAYIFKFKIARSTTRLLLISGVPGNLRCLGLCVSRQSSKLSRLGVELLHLGSEFLMWLNCDIWVQRGGYETFWLEAPVYETKKKVSAKRAV